MFCYVFNLVIQFVPSCAHRVERVTYFVSRCVVDESDSDTDMPRGKVLAAALHLVPGYFSCDCMWQTHFVLHQRLKSTCSSAPRSSVSPGHHWHIVFMPRALCWTGLIWTLLAYNFFPSLPETILLLLLLKLLNLLNPLLTVRKKFLI